jgi:hypothetical protein
MSVKLIGCRGGDPDAPRLLQAEGWLYGFRSDATAYGRPYFVDIKWRDYDWSEHLAVIRFWQPDLAMVADYESPAQKREMLAQVWDVLGAGSWPMVCPKFPGAAADVPAGVIVAISVPTSYAGFLPESGEVAGRKLHLLGGHPDQYVILMRKYAGSRIVSLDCSAIFQKAQDYGSFWSARRNTWREVRNRFHSHTLMRMSARNVRRYLASPPDLFKDRARLHAVGWRLQLPLFQEATV